MRSSSVSEAKLFDGRIISPFQRPFYCSPTVPPRRHLRNFAESFGENFFSVCQNYYYLENYLYLLKKRAFVARTLLATYSSYINRLIKSWRKKRSHYCRAVLPDFFEVAQPAGLVADRLSAHSVIFSIAILQSIIKEFSYKEHIDLLHFIVSVKEYVYVSLLGVYYYYYF